MARKSTIQTNLLGKKVVLNDEWEQTARAMAKYEDDEKPPARGRPWCRRMLDQTAEITTVRSEEGEVTLTLMLESGELIDNVQAKNLKVIR